VAISTIYKQKDVLDSQGTLLYKKHQRNWGVGRNKGPTFWKAIAEAELLVQELAFVQKDSVVISERLW